MTGNERLNQLYAQLETMDAKDFWQIESDFCAALYFGIPQQDRPPCVTAFLTIADWAAKSERNGVWTFYEAATPKDIELTARFLERQGERELAGVFRSGVHDYQNPCYAENYDYPAEWIEEADDIDRWIGQHRDFLWDWERRLLTENKTAIYAASHADPALGG